MQVNIAVGLSVVVLVINTVALFLTALNGSDVEVCPFRLQAAERCRSLDRRVALYSQPCLVQRNVFFWYTAVDLIIVGVYLLLLATQCAAMEQLQQQDEKRLARVALVRSLCCLLTDQS